MYNMTPPPPYTLQNVKSALPSGFGKKSVYYELSK